MMKIDENKEYEFATEFIQRYSQRGFGSMNKNEFEVMIFDLLRKYGNLKGLSHFKISTLLQIPESKVKRLIYEADLKYNQYDEDRIKEEFFKVIEKAKFKKGNEQICFIVENKYLRSAITSDLKDKGYVYDSSFNSEIMSLHIDAFAELLEMYLPKEKKKDILQRCIYDKGQDKNTRISTIIKEALLNYGKKTGSVILSTVLSQITTTAYENFIEFLQNNGCS